ncbi:hypothetical protein INH39_22830 [Massilia violaceinigra]|uniref:Uncharacterized protein n=1 Tax=Massilia violaceinigra TaxID=2045208 RepID=A0ABY4A3L0_9BURK|nr:hypothetical protein [Massilia violaceinigra]UOD28274.1 hypothetical protein INH39_22830 [Massilia violaceinigra]
MTALPHSEHPIASSPCEPCTLMHAQGVGAAQAYAGIRSDGSDQIAAIRMLRKVYGLTLTEAKTVSVEVDTGRSIEQFQRGLAQELLNLLGDLHGDEYAS